MHIARPKPAKNIEALSTRRILKKYSHAILASS
jgi:hypothetical protein